MPPSACLFEKIQRKSVETPRVFIMGAVYGLVKDDQLR